LGSLLNSRHDYTESRTLLARALRRERAPLIIFELAAAQAGLGERTHALRTLNSMPAPAGPEGLPWLRLLGTLNLDEGRVAEATKALEQALELAPDDQIVLYSLGLARLRSSQPTQAAALLGRSFGSLPPAERAFKVGALLAQNGADTDAAVQFERAVREDPQMYDAYFNLAVVHLRRKELDSAADAATHALALRKTGEAYNLLGDLREEQGRYREALENLQEAVRADPPSEEFAFDLGLELILHENSDAAIQWFRAAEKHFPQSSRMALGSGTAEYMSEKQDDAVRSFLKAVDLDPKYEAAYTFLGMAYLSSSNPPDEVLLRLGTLARIDSRSFTAQYYYGAALVQAMDRTGKLDKLDAASEALRQALALHPADAHSYYYLGEVKRLQNQFNEAAQFYEKSVALDPAFADALFKLGRTYARLGRQDDALRILNLHHEVQSKQTESIDKRLQDVKMFILTIRNPK
jgi:tetratricopeptide (TPR) repeat protein